MFTGRDEPRTLGKRSKETKFALSLNYQKLSLSRARACTLSMVCFRFGEHPGARATLERRQPCIAHLLTAFWPDPEDGNTRDRAVDFPCGKRCRRVAGDVLSLFCLDSALGLDADSSHRTQWRLWTAPLWSRFAVLAEQKREEPRR